MKQKVIVNPPIGIYENPKTELKHAVFLLLLDTLARYRSKREKIIFFGRAYNLFGRKSERWNLIEEKEYEDFSREIEKKARKIIEEDTARTKLNLSSLESVLDTDNQIVEGVKEDFLKLNKDGYLIERNGSFFLDCPKIAKNFRLKEKAKGIKIHPIKAKGEFNAMIETNTLTPVKVTRDTFYSPRNPLEGENIGPLFLLANMWDHKFPDSTFTMAASNNVLLKYVFLRFLSRIALSSNPGFDELLVWPKVHFENKEWDIDRFLKDPYHSDMLRCTLLSTYPTQNTDVVIEEGTFKGCRNLVYLLANLRKPLAGDYIDFQEEIFKEYQSNMDNFKYPHVLKRLEKEVRTISAEINGLKNRGCWNDASRAKLAGKYFKILDMLSPFMPATTDLSRKEIKNVI